MVKFFILGRGTRCIAVSYTHLTAAACKMTEAPEVFEEVMIASRTKEKCDKIIKQIDKTNYYSAQIDAMNINELAALIKDFKPDIVLNLALPYQNLAIMEACLQTGVSYLDTVSYTHLDVYKRQALGTMIWSFFLKKSKKFFLIS